MVSIKQREWNVAQVDEQAAAKLVDSLGLHPVVARVFVSRGLSTLDDVSRFLQNGDKAIHDPFLFSSMPIAVERLRQARDQGEPLVVHGDYDVDGITATALTMLFLQAHGWQADWFLPRRLEEGYGVHIETIRALAVQGVKLLLTVDCGITSLEEMEEAAKLGMQVIVTDHHEPIPGQRPRAVAVLNPHCDGYPFTDLAGCGVAYKLICALHTTLDLGAPEPETFLDLVAVGTIADVVRLVGENRALCIQGLRRLRSEPNTGLRALLQVIRTPLAGVDASTVGFQVAPRINAAGRLDDPALALRMLMTDEMDEAERIATELDACNQERRAVEAEVVETAWALLREQPELAQGPVVVLARRDWHLGVVGIAAARLMERLHKPVVLIAVDEDGVGKGSARSVPGVDITSLLRACEDCLLGCGGHEMAAGVKIAEARVPELREKLSKAAEGLGVGPAHVPDLALDGELPLTEIDAELISQLQQLEPYGAGNPIPTFCTRGLDLTGRVQVVGNNHLKLFPQVESWQKISVIGFGKGGMADRLDWRRVDLAYELSLHHYNGQSMPQLKLLDVLSANGVSAQPGQGSAGAGGRAPRRTLGAITVLDGRCDTLTADALGVPRKRRIPAIILLDNVDDLGPALGELQQRYGPQRLLVAANQTEPVAAWLASTCDCLVTTVETCLAGLEDGPSQGKRRFDPGMLLTLACAPFQSPHPRRIAELLTQVTQQVAVRACLTPSLLEREKERALELLPDRAVLKRIYTVLHRNAREDQVDLLALYERLASYRLRRPLLETGLRVFHEAGLLEWDAAVPQARLLPAQAKRELDDSTTFQRCREERDALLGWYDGLRAADSETLFDRLGF